MGAAVHLYCQNKSPASDLYLASGKTYQPILKSNNGKDLQMYWAIIIILVCGRQVNFKKFKIILLFVLYWMWMKAGAVNALNYSKLP